MVDVAEPAAIKVSSTDRFTIHYSPIVRADALNLTILDIDATKAHLYAGAQFFADVLGINPAFPTDGDIQIFWKNTASTPEFESTRDHVIAAKKPTTLTFDGNIMQVKANVARPIIGASHYRIVVTTNEI